MANAVYTKAKQKLLEGVYNLDSDDIKVILVDSADYTPNLATDDELADVTEAGRVATSDALANTSVTDGVFDADDITISTVSGDEFEYLVLYDDTIAGDPLICIFDTAAAGLPCTPNGGDIKVTWNASGIFTLS